MMQSDLIGNVVSAKIGRMAVGDSESKAMLSKLRRGVGKRIEEAYETWDIVISDVPNELLNRSFNINENKAINAIFITLTTYALHQQGTDANMNRTGIRFASAMSKMLDLELRNSLARARV